MSLRRDGSHLTIAVRDDGPGVPPDDRDRIFERFVRRGAPSDGAGLGLPISRWIAEAHGGRLELTASDVPGCEFVVTLPERPL